MIRNSFRFIRDIFYRNIHAVLISILLFILACFLFLREIFFIDVILGFIFGPLLSLIFILLVISFAIKHSKEGTSRFDDILFSLSIILLMSAGMVFETKVISSPEKAGCLPCLFIVPTIITILLFLTVFRKIWREKTRIYELFFLLIITDIAIYHVNEVAWQMFIILVFMRILIWSVLLMFFNLHGQFKTMVRLCDFAMRCSPHKSDLSILHHFKGTALGNLDDIDGARREYEIALNLSTDLSPKGPHLINIAHCDIKNGEYSKAITGIKEFLESDCRKSDKLLSYAYCNMGTAHTLKGELDAGAEFFLKVIDMKKVDAPILLESHFYLGSISQCNKKYEEAKKHYRTAVDLLNAKQIKAAHIHRDLYESSMQASLGEIYALEGNIDEGILNCQKAFETAKIKDAKANVHLHLGNIYFLNKEHEKAFEEYEKSKELFPKNPQVYYRMAQVYLMQNLKEKAIGELKQAAGLVPENMYAHLAREKLLELEVEN